MQLHHFMHLHQFSCYGTTQMAHSCIFNFAIIVYSSCSSGSPQLLCTAHTVAHDKPFYTCIYCQDHYTLTFQAQILTVALGYARPQCNERLTSRLLLFSMLSATLNGGQYDHLHDTISTAILLQSILLYSLRHANDHDVHLTELRLRNVKGETLLAQPQLLEVYRGDKLEGRFDKKLQTGRSRSRLRNPSIVVLPYTLPTSMKFSK